MDALLTAIKSGDFTIIFGIFLFLNVFVYLGCIVYCRYAFLKKLMPLLWGKMPDYLIEYTPGPMFIRSTHYMFAVIFMREPVRKKLGIPKYDYSKYLSKSDLLVCKIHFAAVLLMFFNLAFFYVARYFFGAFPD